ncbi:hypothetical protein AACH06_05340 [Ideonella sp. DXS29W]|uniref:DUF2244 domain-containing protein n=1 Tax=Ideonella lacteola TaxID=2984193 RepID=A0ABU9BKF8_9BURK
MTTDALQPHPVGVLLAIACLSGLILIGVLLRRQSRSKVAKQDQRVQRVGSLQAVRRADHSRLIALRIDVHVVEAVRSGERRIQITVARNGATVSLDSASVGDARSLADRLRKAAARCGAT